MQSFTREKTPPINVHFVRDLYLVCVQRPTYFAQNGCQGNTSPPGIISDAYRGVWRNDSDVSLHQLGLISNGFLSANLIHFVLAHEA